MKFLADECCDNGLVASLREDGHDVLYVLERNPGAPDDEILNLAFDEKRILITEDKDFGELVYRQKKPVKGIVLIRIGVAERHRKWPRLKHLIDNNSDRLPDHFVVIDTEKIRFRSLIFPL